MRDLKELDKLEQYLKLKGIQYERIDKEDKPLDDEHQYALIEFEQHQIIVYEDGKRKWDAICHRGSLEQKKSCWKSMAKLSLLRLETA